VVGPTLETGSAGAEDAAKPRTVIEPSPASGRSSALTVSLARRLPGIDGLRVVAVLAVFGVHACPGLVPGGYIGVDIFFVISGFVITRMLLRQPLDGPGLRRFYVDRLTRLAPALIAMVALSAVVLALRRQHGDFALIPFALTYTMDFFRVARPEHATGAFLHTWSLAIEEQFYLVWGLVVALLIQRRRGRSVAWVAGGLAVLSVLDIVGINAIHGAVASEVRVYNGPDTRSVQLLVGCLLAALLNQSGRATDWLAKTPSWLTWLAAGSLLAWMLEIPNYRYNAHMLVTLPLIAVLAGCLILALALRPEHPITRLLGNGHLATMGARYSYGFYLWHYPVLQLVGGPPGDPARVVLSLGLSAFLAFASWTLVERRLTALRHRQSVCRAR
jgi:peptidoglycan/LPS O-acetylase OafA/YrhL